MSINILDLPKRDFWLRPCWWNTQLTRYFTCRARLYTCNKQYSKLFYYLRQVNELNGGDTVFVRCVSVCLCVCAPRTGQSDQFKKVKATDFKFDTHVSRDGPDMTHIFFSKSGVARVTWPPKFFWLVNANSSKTVKATDFKFDNHVPRDSPDMTTYNYCSLEIHLAEIMHSHGRLL